MQNTAWKQLFQRIPSDQHDSLVLMTINGTELMLQRLVRLESDFVVAVGRPAGSTDQGKALVIPYDQLTYMAMTKQMTDSEIQAVLGSPGAASIPEAMPTFAGPAEQVASVTSLDAATERMAAITPTFVDPTSDTPGPAASDHKANAKPPSKGGPPSKSMLLARLRQRLAEDKNKQIK